MVSGAASESPRWRTLPASTSSAMAPTVSSIGTFAVDAVLVVKVDHIHAEALQGGVAARPNVFRVAANAEEVALLVADVAELGGQHHLAAPLRAGTANEALIGRG
jgi:hypothetical protein